MISKICRFSSFSLEFQIFFSITRTIPSHSQNNFGNKDHFCASNKFVASKPPKFNFVDHQIFFLTNFFFTFFFNSSKPVLTEKIYVDWPIRNLFSQQKVNLKKQTADISLKEYLVIHEILVVWMPRMSYRSLFLFYLYSTKYSK